MHLGRLEGNPGKISGHIPMLFAFHIFLCILHGHIYPQSMSVWAQSRTVSTICLLCCCDNAYSTCPRSLSRKRAAFLLLHTFSSALDGHTDVSAASADCLAWLRGRRRTTLSVLVPRSLARSLAQPGLAVCSLNLRPPRPWPPSSAWPAAPPWPAALPPAFPSCPTRPPARP